MQVELLDRQRWQTRVELANALFEYLEIFHNRQRRHSALGMLSPIEYELRAPPRACSMTTTQYPDSRETQGTSLQGHQRTRLGRLTNQVMSGSRESNHLVLSRCRGECELVAVPASVKAVCQIKASQAQEGRMAEWCLLSSCSTALR